MQSELHFFDNHLYCSNTFLIKNNISRKTIEDWTQRKRIEQISFEGVKFTLYASIPAPTLAKLPKEPELLIAYHDQQKDNIVTSIYEKLKYVQTQKFDGYQKVYRNEYGLDKTKALAKAMKAATWKRLLEIFTEYKTGSKGGVQKGMADAIQKAYLRLYPGKLESKAAFSRAIDDATTKGITAYCVDGRVLSNRNKPNQQFDDRHLTMLCSFYIPGKKNRAPQILRQMIKACELADLKCPGESWVKKNMYDLEKNPTLYQSRYGAMATDHVLPTMDLLPASYAGNQFQVDGFVMPFLYQNKDRHGKISYKRPVLTAVFDNHSKKIVGYSVSISESREALLQAFEETVKNTDGLAYEIVSDNHSFNETKEVINFKEMIAALGIVWTVTSNPRQKIVAESGFKYISENYCKPHPGYLGLGVTTKNKNSRPSQEEIDKYLKADHRLSYDEIAAIAVQIVEAWNNEKAPGRNNTPNKLWNNSKKPHLRTIDEMDRMRLFTRSAIYKITKYQINLRIAGIEYHYQLKIDFAKYNGEEVIVRYVNFDEIYIFEPKNDVFICSIKRKKAAHSALIDQTPEDIEIFNQQTAFRKAVMSRGKQEVIDMVNRAEEMMPGFTSFLNEMNTPKSIIQLARENDDLNMALRIKDIDVEHIPVKAKTSGLNHPAFKQTAKKANSPYHDENHKISIMTED